MPIPSLTTNRLLATLSEADLAIVLEASDIVDLVPRSVIFEPGQRIDAVYFPLNGLISLSVIGENGDETASAAVGREGVVGLGGLVSGATSFSRQSVQLGGRAARLARARFLDMLERSPDFRRLLTTHHDAFAAHLLQLVFCHSMHAAEQRLSRWLLNAFDSIGDDASIEITQEALALGLGLRRATVTLALNTLADTNAIAIERGRLTLVSRPRLEARACPCYAVIRENYEHVLTLD